MRGRRREAEARRAEETAVLVLAIVTSSGMQDPDKIPRSKELSASSQSRGPLRPGEEGDDEALAVVQEVRARAVLWCGVAVTDLRLQVPHVNGNREGVTGALCVTDGGKGNGGEEL